jgi:hypothetical protein
VYLILTELELYLVEVTFLAIAMHELIFFNTSLNII